MASTLRSESSLPFASRVELSNALGAADSSSYLISVARSGSLAASNASQRLGARFTSAGVRLSSASAEVGLRLDALGGASALRPVAPASPEAHANRVSYAHPGVSEWYSNGPLGIEQGFTLQHAPGGAGAGKLTVALQISGDARAALAAGARSVTFSTGARVALRYGGLRVTDARGRTLPSSLGLSGDRLLISADTRGAAYPVTVDPLVQDGGKLTAGGSDEGSMLGYSIALSGDGSTVAVGGPSDENGAGAVWVFVRSGGSWAQQGPKLVGEEGSEASTQCGEEEEPEEECAFGRSVAISADGNTVLVGAPHASGPCTLEGGVCVFQGAAVVYARSGASWHRQAVLTGGAEETAEGRFGRGVALSADGSTALVGAPHNKAGTGAAWVFTRTGSAWSQQGPRLLGAGSQGESHVGVSVSLSEDGGTALVGGPGDSGGVGAAWVFTRSGSSWGEGGEKLIGSGSSPGLHFGNSVALAGSGGTAVIGCREVEHNGGAWVFAHSGGGWAQQGPELTDTEAGPSPPQFGYGVAISASGNTILIGGPSDQNGTGAAWLYTRSGSSWTLDGEKLTGLESAGNAARRGRFGYSVALRGDGETAVIGSPGDTGRTGALWAFSEAALLPAVHSVTPNYGPVSGGTIVTIEGGTLAGATEVTFEAAHEVRHTANFTVNPSGSITAIAPPSPTGRPGEVFVRVTGPTGTSPGTATSVFTYFAGGAPSGSPEDPAVSVGAGSARGSLGGVLAFTSGCTPALVSRSIIVGKRLRAAVRLVWRGRNSCRGKLTLRVSLKKGKHYKLKALGASAAFTLTPYLVRSVTVKLNALGRSLFRRHPKGLGASLLVVKLSPGSVQARTSKVRLVKPKPKRRR